MREDVLAFHLPIGVFKNPLWVGADTKMRTQYLPAHCLNVLFGVNHTFAV